MSLHVERSGSGRDLVLLHGWGLHGGIWSGAIADLSARFRVHAVDLPGHGRSAAAAFGDLDAVVDLVAQAIPEAAIVCGWSLGGLLAQRLAVRHAACVRALALVATTPCFVERGDWEHGVKAEVLAGFSADLRRDPQATLRAFVTLNAAGGAQGRSALRELAAEFASLGAPHSAVLDAGLSALETADLRGDTAAIRQPAVVIHGGRDALVPIGAGRWLAAHIAGARMVELERCAHLPFISHRAEFVDALTSLNG